MRNASVCTGVFLSLYAGTYPGVRKKQCSKVKSSKSPFLKGTRIQWAPQGRSCILVISQFPVPRTSRAPCAPVCPPGPYQMSSQPCPRVKKGRVTNESASTMTRAWPDLVGRVDQQSWGEVASRNFQVPMLWFSAIRIPGSPVAITALKGKGLGNSVSTNHTGYRGKHISYDV